MAENRREPYAAPAVRRIHLASEELAATACKSTKLGLFCNKSGKLINKDIGS